MALSGPDPKPARLGHSTSVDWTDVPDVPFDDGGRRDLPRTPGGRRKWHAQLLEWWAEVRRMPHCVLWADTDWRYALDTAALKQQLWVAIEVGEVRSTLATEVRRREDQMGTTCEARRKLRIRYVSVDQAKRRHPYTGGPGQAGNVVQMDDRRARVAGG